MPSQWILFVAAAATLPPKVRSLTLHPSNNHFNRNHPEITRRDCLASSLTSLLGTTFLLPSPSVAAIDDDDTHQGISAITDSPLGKAIRRAVLKSARIADSLDERWERFSDSLRDEARCDEITHRRLYDNGVRKDGTPVGNPGLGELCEPRTSEPWSEATAGQVLGLAVRSAVAKGGRGEEEAAVLAGKIEEIERLVASAYERRERSAETEEQKVRVRFNFRLYATLRAIADYLKERNRKEHIQQFQLEWGRSLVQTYAPSATRDDFASPFPQRDEEYQDYDYDKNKLLNALGKLTRVLERLKSDGWMTYYEISIPYDDYGSVVTVAIDDYVPIGTEILLAEQGYRCEGPMQALVKYLLDASGINFTLDTFYIDPSTTRQIDYNPTQLLLSINNLRAT
ncbi:hypothetical protein ACHAW6_014265 [Cyclotella cf. meneghiniana]